MVNKALTPILFVLTLAVSPAAYAQAPQVVGALPGGGPRGGVTTVDVQGQNLAGAKFHTLGRGVSVRKVEVNAGGNRLTAEVEVARDAWLGPHELRITTSRGISNGMRFWVDTLPNVMAPFIQEGQDPFMLNGKGESVYNGRIGRSAGRDRFNFEAKPGQTWVFQCAANRIHSRFDPVLELRDDAQRILTIAQGTWESDPLLTFRPTKAGKYTITLRDSEFKGGPDFTYRFTGGIRPAVAGFLPRGGRPGSDLEVSIEGPNLGLSKARAAIPATAGPGEYWAEAKTADGKSFALPLQIDPMSVTCAPESGETTLPAIPSIVDGVFSKQPVTRFRFHAATKDKILFDLYGRRIGSRIDGCLRVLDSAGKEVFVVDDTVGKDARMEVAPPGIGDYVLEVSNVEEKTGPDCYWRLVAKMVEPDFQIELRTDRVQVPAGTTITFPVEVTRLGGYTGPVEARAEGLPKGVTSTVAVVPPDKTKGEITLTAAADAPVEASELRVFGTIQTGGKTITHEAQGWEQYEHRSIDQVLAKEYSYTRPHYDWDLLLIAVTENKLAFTVNVEPDEVALPPGGKCEFTVKVDRKGANPGVVKLSFQNLPRGVTASVSEIPEGKNGVRISLTAAPDAPAEIPYVIVTGNIGSASATSRPLRVAVIK
jgi:hypothetical protein